MLFLMRMIHGIVISKLTPPFYEILFNPFFLLKFRKINSSGKKIHVLFRVQVNLIFR